jgi:uncharacterized protein YciI
MATYVFYGLDGPDGLAIRKTTRPAHLDFIRSLGGRVRVGGPMLGADGGAPVGTMLVIEAETLDDAKATMANDPYAHAKLFKSTDIRPFDWILK